MATKYISSITLPNGDIANLVDKSSGYTTNTGTITDVKVGTTSSNASSVVSGSVATLLVNTAYNASTNKIATMSDVAAGGGLEAFPVTLTEDLEGDYSLDKSFQDIRTAYNAGKYIYLNVNGDIYNLIGFDEYTFYFSNTIFEGNSIIVNTYFAEDDGTVENTISTVNGVKSYGLEEFTDWYSYSGTYNANNAPLGTVRTRTSYVTSNLPSGIGNFGFLFTTGTTNTSGSSSYRVQTYYDTSTNGITGVYTRFLSGGTWYPWVLIGPASYTDANNISY